MPRRKRLRSASLATHATQACAWRATEIGGPAPAAESLARKLVRRPQCGLLLRCHYHRHSSYASSQCLFASLGTALNGLRHDVDAGLEADAGSDRCAIQDEPRSPRSCPEMFRGPASRPASTAARSECMLWRERTNLPFLPGPALGHSQSLWPSEPSHPRHTMGRRNQRLRLSRRLRHVAPELSQRHAAPRCCGPKHELPGFKAIDALQAGRSTAGKLARPHSTTRHQGCINHPRTGG